MVTNAIMVVWEVKKNFHFLQSNFINLNLEILILDIFHDFLKLLILLRHFYVYHNIQWQKKLLLNHLQQIIQNHPIHIHVLL